MLKVENGRLKGDEDREIVLRGIGGTTSEYLFKHPIPGNNEQFTLGFLKFNVKQQQNTQFSKCNIDFNQPFNVAYNDTNGIDSQLAVIPKKTNSQIKPTFRIPLNLDYYLNEPENALGCYEQWGSSNIYQKCIDLLVKKFTDDNVYVILDLHWNAAGKGREQSMENDDGCMACEQAVLFWKTVAKRYQDNDLVLFELFNEPMGNDEQLPYKVWLDGCDENRRPGMKQLYKAVRDTGAGNIVIVGGNNWAYNSEYCRGFQNDVTPENAIYSLHPYQGKGQGCEKSVRGFERAASQVLESGPIIVTEFGQYCREDNYAEQIIQTCEKMNISWLLWAWRPEEGGCCDQPDVNDRASLIDPSTMNGAGANWSLLWPEYSIRELGNKRTQ